MTNLPQGVGKSCPLCGGPEPAPWGIWAPNLRRCQSCGIVCSGLLLEDREALVRENSEVFGGFGSDRWSRLYTRAKNHGIYRYLRALPAGAPVLEIGPGDGEFLAGLAARGYVAAGLDISRRICDAVIRRTGIPMICGEIDALDGTPRYDAVVAQHVIEHIAEPRNFLGMIRAALKPAGVLLLTCPNVESRNAGWPGWGGYQRYHAYYYSRDTLSGLVAAAGFDLVHKGTREVFGAFWDTVYRTAIKADPFAPPAPVRPEPAGGGLRIPLAGNLVKLAASLLHLSTAWTVSRSGRGDELVFLARRPG